MTRKWKSVTAALGVVALLAPVASAERPAQKKSKTKKAKTEKAAKAKNAVFRGTVVSADATAVVVDVTSASRWGRDAVGGDPETFTVEGARVKVQDTNGNGPGLDDFVAGDRVHVIARVARDQDLTQPIAARKVDNKTAKTPEAAGAETGTETGTETPPAS